MKFNVGDKVRIIIPPQDPCYIFNGLIGEVQSVDKDAEHYYVNTIDRGMIRCHRNELELITTTDETAPEKGEAQAVNHPAHYGGGDNPYEAIKVIEAWGLGFSLGNLVKYVARAGKKDQAKELEDLKKGRFYLDRHISNLEAKE